MSAKYIRLANYLRSMIAQNRNNFMKLPTEYELCRQYGVSRQTVRKALSILAEENLIQKKQGSGSYASKAASVVSQKTIALLLSSDSEYSYPALIADIKSTLQGEGYSVLVFVTENQVSKERELLQEILLKPIRGVIAEGCKNLLPSPNDDLYAKFQAHGTAVLFLYGNYPNLREYPCLQSDNYAGGYLLCHHLASHAHRLIAGIFQSDTQAGIDRCHGYMTALRDQNLPIIDDNICWYSNSQLSFLREKKDTGFLSEFIHKKLISCSAVICQNDEIAYWLIKELKYAGIQVPENLSVVCFHNTYLNDLSDVHVTTLSHKPHEAGSAAANKLLQLLRGLPVPSTKLPFHFIERGSVKTFSN